MKLKDCLAGTISFIVLVLVWFAGSLFIGSSFILPSPAEVFFDFLVLVREQSFAIMFGMTFYRGILAFSISLILSSLFGCAAGIYPAFSSALKPWMTTIKSTPVVSFILIAILWFGSSRVAIFVAVLMTLPVMTEAIAQGVRNTDIKLLEMARVYRFSRRSVLFNIRIPSALPFFLAGAGASLGLTWKVVVAGEILGSPKIGIGTAMQTAKIHLETARVFSLTITAILLSIFTELLFDYLVHRSARHTEREAGE